MPGIVEKIFVASKGGVGMQPLQEVEALEGCGLRGDRYCENIGFWRGVDECQVTLISGEALDEIVRERLLPLSNGEHRRNLVVRGIPLSNLEGKRFRIGESLLEFDRPRPPCRYIESITAPGMTKALARGAGGICARVIASGVIRCGDAIDIL
jgi:MOSC domain-containing protein YiiM